MPAVSKTTITQSDINFNVTPAKTHVNARLDNNGENGSPVINAVNIDWNEAKLGETIINTTGQLLSYMSVIAQKIENFENILINL